MSVDRKRLFLLTGKFTVYFCLMAATFAFILYLQIFRPTLVKELIISVDVVGVTSLAQSEQNRQIQINQLPITFEEKQVLINKTVFLGATPQMVQLALGSPKESKRGGRETIYIYYLPDDPRPTILRFQRDRLVHAYKGSALDLAGPPRLPAPHTP